MCVYVHVLPCECTTASAGKLRYSKAEAQRACLTIAATKGRLRAWASPAQVGAMTVVLALARGRTLQH